MSRPRGVIPAARMPVTVLVVGLAVAGCSAEPSGGAAGGHSHAGGGQVSLPVGDGLAASEVGYSLTDVALDVHPGHAGQVSFRVDDAEGEPVTDYVEELTRDLHLYVVREDLEVFRHLHPTIADDGTWTAPVSLPAGGDYRVITEFVARDTGGNGDHLVLGETVPVGGGAERAERGGDPMLRVDVAEAPTAGPDGRLVLEVTDDGGRPVKVGTYLGAYGHVTGFHRQTGSMVHMHPLTAPETTDDGAALTFHTEVDQPGDYQLFVQVRVDGFLHTVPVSLTVGSATGA